MSSLIDGYLEEETKKAPQNQPTKKDVKRSYIKAGLFDSSSSSDDDFYDRPSYPVKLKEIKEDVENHQ